jgi:hypothetical protein
LRTRIDAPAAGAQADDVVEIISAGDLRMRIQNDWPLDLAGVLSLFAGERWSR